MEKNIKTSDNYVYHQSLNQDKCNILTQFMHNNMDNINTLLDIGCNTGALSYKYNNIIKVKGIDISKKEDLKIPNDYNFSQCDISKLKYLDIKYDVIFFLSVYHHLLGKYGVKYADNIFYMILFNSKYLLFDVGNVSETGRKEQEWYKKQVQIFNNEKQLLDHFQIPYKILGEWNVTSGKRSIILFESKNIFKNLKIDGAYRRLDGGQYRDIGLIKKDNWNKALTFWKTLNSDEDSKFDKEININASDIEPLVTWGTSPQDVASVTGNIPDPEKENDEERKVAMYRSLEYMGLKPNIKISDIKIDKVFIGSCTNGRIEDLRNAAKIAKGKKIAKTVSAMVVPGSGLIKDQAEKEGLDKVFIEAGFEWREPGCSMCLAMNADKLNPKERCASTSNRNFEGRQGRGGRTHLVSPAMAVAAAIDGFLTDVRKFQ